jgi:hypothetical protein
MLPNSAGFPGEALLNNASAFINLLSDGLGSLRGAGITIDTHDGAASFGVIRSFSARRFRRVAGQLQAGDNSGVSRCLCAL